MKNISYNTSGFLSKTKYSAHFSNYFEKLKQLSAIAQVDVFLFEETTSYVESLPTSIRFSDDGNGCTINIPFSRYYQPNSDLWFTPTAKEVFDTIDQVMLAADAIYKDEFFCEPV